MLPLVGNEFLFPPASQNRQPIASPFFSVQAFSASPVLILSWMAVLGEVGSLGRLLERDEYIRGLGRSKKQLTQWPVGDDGDVLTGVVSCPALACNVTLMVACVNWWALHQAEPKTIPIPIIKPEVGGPLGCKTWVMEVFVCVCIYIFFRCKNKIFRA